MSGRRSSIHSDTENDDEPLICINNTDLNVKNNDDDRLSETETLLDEVRVEPALTSSHCCANAPARYIIAGWAFFGFFSYYAVRVNLSLAIVAMVCLNIFLDRRVKIENICFD